MSDVRTEFNDALTDLGESITAIADRITNLPDDPKDITAEDIAAIKAMGARINDLAVAAPEIPTGDPAPQDPNPATPAPAEGTSEDGAVVAPPAGPEADQNV